MFIFREVISIIFFAAGAVLLCTLFFDPIAWIEVALGVFSLGLAYLLWPNSKQHQGKETGWIHDILEFVIELPINLLVWLFRFLAGIFRSKGFDLDF